ncbi:MAG: carbohydrate ABC transporter permease [Mycobacteriales bacterium]
MAGEARVTDRATGAPPRNAFGKSGRTRGDAPTGRATARPVRRAGEGLRKKAELALFLGPALLLFVGFVLVPIAVATYYSFYNWSGFGGLHNFSGLTNYREALKGSVFHQAVQHNLIIAALSITVQLPISIGMALLLNRKLRGRAFLRLVVFAPFTLSEAVTAVTWALMLQPHGFVDRVFRAVGLGGLVHHWLADTHLVLYTIFVVLTWKFIGFGIILLLAGLQGIPNELREAAALDGANPWQTTWRVVLPLLAPTIRIWIFLSVIGSLQVFDVVWIMTGGGPANSSTTMSVYVIDHGFRRYEFGYGSAVAVILFIICFVFALFYQRFALRRDTFGALTDRTR